MKRKHSHGHGHDHDNNERWLLTYADLITLLLGLFVILYAMSKIDAGKYAQIVAAMGGVFGGSKPTVLQGVGGVLADPLNILGTERARIEQEIRSALQGENGNESIFLTQDERGVTVHILDEMLFNSGEAALKESSIRVLDSLSSVLRKLPNDLRVEGHTDNVPIHSGAFPSNWHLSVARAVNAGYYLIQRHNLQADRVSVVGFSEYRPLVPNTTSENRARNRRVDIVVLVGAIPGEIGNSPKTDSTRISKEIRQ